MKFYQKYKLYLSDYAYGFAQHDIGSLREVLRGSATIWYSYNEYQYYAVDPEVVAFYEDLEDALANLEELQNVLTDAHWETYDEDPDQEVSDWIYDRFYFVFDDAREMIRRFARWDDARKSFVDIIAMEAAEDQSLETLLDEFARRVF